MKTCLTNAFSINMLNDDTDLEFQRIDDPVTLIDNSDFVTNAIGHATTDTLIRSILKIDNCEVPPGKRRTVSIDNFDRLLVAQYRGPRLAEGATKLPADAHIEWWCVERC